MPDWEHKYVDVAGVRAHYIEAGKGHDQAVLLVHGGGISASAEVNYGAVMGSLGRNLHAIAVDVVGYGRTPAPSEEYYPESAQGDFLIRFMETLDLTAHLVGNSRGGSLVSYIAHEAPHRAKSVIIINSGSAILTPSYEYYVWDSERRRYRHPRHRFTTTISSEKPPTREEVRMKQLKNFYNKALVTDEYVELAYEIAQLNHAYGRARSRSRFADNESRAYQFYKGKFMGEHAPSLTVPMLMTFSRENPGCAPYQALDRFNEMDNVEMHVFANARHMVMLEYPERWSSVVTDFIMHTAAK